MMMIVVCHRAQLKVPATKDKDLVLKTQNALTTKDLSAKLASAQTRPIFQRKAILTTQLQSIEKLAF